MANIDNSLYNSIRLFYFGIDNFKEFKLKLNLYQLKHQFKITAAIIEYIDYTIGAKHGCYIILLALLVCDTGCFTERKKKERKK